MDQSWRSASDRHGSLKATVKGGRQHRQIMGNGSRSVVMLIIHSSPWSRGQGVREAVQQGYICMFWTFNILWKFPKHTLSLFNDRKDMYPLCPGLRVSDAVKTWKETYTPSLALNAALVLDQYWYPPTSLWKYRKCMEVNLETHSCPMTEKKLVLCVFTRICAFEHAGSSFAQLMASVCNKLQRVVWISESVIWKQVPAQCTSCKPANYKCAMLSEKEPRKITMAAECWAENKSSRLLSGGGLRPGGALKQTLHQVVSLCDIIASVLNFPLLQRWATATSAGVSVALSGQRQPPTAASLY